MGSESIAHEAEGQIGYWLRGHEGERNNCCSKFQLVGQKYWDKTALANKTRFSRHCFGFQSWRFSLLVGELLVKSSGLCLSVSRQVQKIKVQNALSCSLAILAKILGSSLVNSSAIVYCSTRTMQSCDSQAFQFLDDFSGNYVVLLMSFSSYSGTPLIWSPMGQKNLAVLTGWPYYRGRLKFHDLRAIMSNTLYSKFAFLEQLFSLINNRNVDITYSNRRKLLKISLQCIKHKNRLRVRGQ